VGGNLHPAWYLLVLKVFEDALANDPAAAKATDAVFRASSRMELGYRVASDESLWLCLYRGPDDLDDDFIDLDVADVHGYKLDYFAQVNDHTRNRFEYRFADNQPAASDLFTHENAGSTWYVGVVVTPNDAASIDAFTKSLEGIPMTHLEIDGVGFPVTMKERRMRQAELDVFDTTASLETFYDTQTYGATQQLPVEDGDERHVNLYNKRGVRAFGYNSQSHVPNLYGPLRFNLRNAAGVDQLGVGAKRWWELKARGARFPEAAPSAFDRPYALRRFNGREYRSWFDSTDERVRLIAGHGAGTLTRTLFRSLGTGTLTSMVLTDVRYLSESVVRIYAAMGEPVPPASISVTNVTRGWTVDQLNVQPTPLQRDEWQVDLAAGHVIEDGDELLVRIGAPGHTNVTYSHRSLTWREA